MSLTISVVPHELWRTECSRVHFRDFEHFESCVLAPKLKPYDETLPRIVTATFSENRRCQEGLEECTIFTIDCDAKLGSVSAEQLKQSFPYRAVVACTKSGVGNWRIFVKLPRRLTSVHEFRAVYEEARPWLPISTDPASSNPAQPWVPPPCQPLVGEYVAFSIHREIIPVAIMLQMYAERIEREELERANQPDLEGDMVARAIAYLGKMDPAISGAGGHIATFRAARVLVHGCELDDRTAYRLLDEHYNRVKCFPRWKPRELWHKIKDARYTNRLENRPREGV